MIEFVGVTRTYASKIAVANLELIVPRGELFAFLGPNGAGKTTTIKMLVGLLRPTTGLVRVCGYDVVADRREANQRVGYVPDEPYLYDKLTGREFLEFIGGMYGMNQRETAHRVEREIERFELSGFVDDLAESYSHGMKQRVVFAAALLHDPAVLVLDEPTVGLDPRSIRLVKDLLRNKAREGTTIFMSTHSLSVAEEIADRVGIVSFGKLLRLGTIDELHASSAQGRRTLEQLFLDATTAGDESPATVVAPTANAADARSEKT